MKKSATGVAGATALPLLAAGRASALSAGKGELGLVGADQTSS